MTDDRQCPECGALFGRIEGINICEDLFHAALAMEWVDPPKTYAAHHLLVATYTLQHPSQLTPEAEAWYASTVIDAVEKSWSSGELRDRHRYQFNQEKRSWNITPKEPRPVVMRRWSATIADVTDGPAEELPERVWQWARAVRHDLLGP